MKFSTLPAKNTLGYWFLAKDRIFANLKLDVLDYENKNKRRVFINRGSNILFVAHLDTVLIPQIKRITTTRIYATGLDDRLRAYTAYNLSQELKTDLLLTDNEEIAQSTAEFHKCKNYNWIAEFDRAGRDVVTYNIHNKKFKEAIKLLWKSGTGSFSDIAFLDIKACCMNVGIGYQKAHEENSYVDLPAYKKQMNKFRQFFEKNKNIEFIADETIRYLDKFSCCPMESEHLLLGSKFAPCDWCGEFIYSDLLVFIRGLRVCDNCIGYVNQFYGNKSEITI